MRYLIGVDAGGTKTIAAVYNLEGFRLAAFSTGPGNLTAGGAQAAENICRAVQGAMDAAQGQCCFIGVGMAGFDPDAAPVDMQSLLGRRFGVPNAVVNDGTLALYGAHGGQDGLLVIAGTGSIAYGKRGDTLLRRGGWGHILGDRGSGYAIAVDAVRQALRDQDEGRPESPLTLGLLHRLGYGRLRQLLEHVYSRPKADTALLATTVAEFAAGGDKVAADILCCAGVELAAMALGLEERLALPAPQVALAGSILENIPAVRQSFLQELHRGCPQAVLLEEKVEPQRGALYLYKQNEGACD